MKMAPPVVQDMLGNEVKRRERLTNVNGFENLVADVSISREYARFQEDHN